MAFDKTLPTNSTKIRNYPTVLTDNFAAIQEGDLTLTHWQVNFIDRDSVVGPSADPTRQDDTMILFSKEDGSGNTELYFLDDQSPANNVQITELGNLGSQNTNVYASSVSFDGGTFSNNQNAMCTAWASVVVTGSSITSQTNYGMSFGREDQGKYRATFSGGQVTNNNYVVVGTAFSSSGGGEGTCLSIDASGSKSTTIFDIILRKNNDNTRADRSFTVAVFGGR